MGVVCALLLTLACASHGEALAAEPTNDSLRAGIAAYETLDYRHAVELLERARGETLSNEERVLVLRTLGSAYIALSEEPRARAVFETLLRMQPDAQFDRSVSPRIRDVFDSVRRQQAAEAPRLTVPPPGTGQADLAPAAAVQPAFATNATPARRPLYKKAWFWSVIGVATLAAVGGVLGGVLGTQGGTLAVGGVQ